MAGLRPSWKWYAEFLDPSRLRENAAETHFCSDPRHLKELEVQARWFSGGFGTEFITTRGDRVKVLQLGIWNREAGPDFAEAAISINGGEPIRGCIELDPDVRDWERHGHSTNPDYESVVLHLFWKPRQALCSAAPHQEIFTRTAANRCVPQVLLDVEPLAELEALGAPPPAKPGRCFNVLRELSGECVRQIIEAASQFRLARKSAPLARLVEIHGPDEALYQALAVSLGYKSNKLPFALLSQRLPLGLIQKNKCDADALLFGVAGFIDPTDLSLFDLETRAYLRQLWDKWWVRRIEFQRIVLAKTEWRFSGIRPANDPHRRVAALLALTHHWHQIRTLAKKCQADQIRQFLLNLEDEFWGFHYSFHSARTSKCMALVGDSRVNEMLANVFFPFSIGAAPIGSDAGLLWGAFKQLPAALSNRRVEIAAIRLFGEDRSCRDFCHSLVHQQGLLQIYEDFCMRDSSDCLRCPFPEQCVNWPDRGQ